MLPLIIRSKGLSASYLLAHYSDFVQSVYPDNLIGHYPLNETSGSNVYSTKNYAGNICRNPGLEVIGAVVPWNWTYQEGTGSGDVAIETVNVQSGVNAVKVVCGTSYWQTKLISQFDGSSNNQPRLTAGTTYTLRFWTAGDGTHAGLYQVYDITHSANIIADKTTGVSGTSYAQVTDTFTVPAGCLALYINFMASPTGASAYYDDIEVIAPASENPTKLTIIGAPTMSEPGIGDGLTCMYFDGTDDGIYTTYKNGSCIHNVLYDAYKTSQEVTAMIWFKPWDASMWTEDDASDSTTHDLFSFGGLTRAGNSDGSKICLDKWGSEDHALSGIPPQTYGSGGVDANWYFVALSWSKLKDRIRQYFNGLPNTHLWWENTGLTTFDTGLINNIGIGVRDIEPSQYWHGHLAHFAIWDCELPQSTIRRLAL
jgi:hypothetical protein